jgi:hypothetical protein
MIAHFRRIVSRGLSAHERVGYYPALDEPGTIIREQRRHVRVGSDLGRIGEPIE